jgi:hypothetical protein
MLDDDSRRLINNQKFEHSNHAFRSNGRSGISDFLILLQRFRSDRFEKTDLEEALDLIDVMRETHKDCESCTLKILAFSELFSFNRLPDRYCRYRMEYDRWKTLEIEEHMIEEGTGRDYTREVMDSALRELGADVYASLGLPAH